MIAVIIAGGSGTRLWPLSTPDYPKHLLCLIGERSLMQYSYDRARIIGETVYVLPEIGHAGHVRKQLPDLSKDSIIVEPERRGTANGIILALDYIKRMGHPTDEPIAFLWADQYVRDTAGFAHSFESAEAASKRTNRIVLVGIEPDYPATGFGYIQKDGLFDEKDFIFNVDSFKEKPTYELAQQYVKSGQYLWNSGYLVGSLQTFEETIKQYAPSLYKNYQQLQSAKTDEQRTKVYLSFSPQAIDYALTEKVKNLLVVPANFDWLDLGSYGDLHKASESDEKGNHVLGKRIEMDSVEQSFIQNHEDKPVAVIGLDNVVVVNTKDGLLVARKDMAQQVGELSKRFERKD